MNDLTFYLLATAVIVILTVVAGRMMSRRRSSASSVDSQPMFTPQPGEDRCLLRADLNFTNDSPATSRVTLTYYSGDQQRREVLSSAMTQRDFNKLRAQLRSDGWREQGSNSDREGESYTFRRH